MVLVIGFTALAAVLVLVGVDVSKVFLAQRALASAADAAAVAAAQGVDTQRVYAGSGLGCSGVLPLDQHLAAQRAAASLAGQRAGLRHVFVSLAAPDTTVAGRTARVSLHGRVAVPFGAALAWLDPGHGNGQIGVTETSAARSIVGC